MTAIVAYIILGIIAGFLAGLLGVGGGLVIVPGLLIVFNLIGMPVEFQQHLAVGTSLATIMFTGISSMRAHHKIGNVRWDIWKQIAPGIVIGTFAGALIAGAFSSTALKWIFVLFAYTVGIQMFLNLTAKSSRELPKTAALTGVGTVIGTLSSWVGIGGGSLSVPYLMFCNVPVKQSIGTSSAIGIVIAISGTVGFIFGGQSTANLPAGSLGFVFIPALLGIVIVSIPMAKVGAIVANKLPVAVLKRCFAVLLIILASKMLWDILS